MSVTITDILNAIAATNVPYGTITPAVRLANTLTDEIEDADLPARVITAIGGIGARRNVTLTSVGQHIIRWQLDDLLLVRSVGLGRGMRDEAGALATYVYTYARAIKPLRARTGTWVVSDWSAEIGVITYPAGTDRAYEGVRVVLSVDHIITEDEP
jgi:hypothetical protein